MRMGAGSVKDARHFTQGGDFETFLNGGDQMLSWTAREGESLVYLPRDEKFHVMRNQEVGRSRKRMARERERERR